MNKKYKMLLIIGLIILGLVISPFFQFIKSISVMSIYSAYEKRNSLLEEENISLSMPGGLSTITKDWYPFVMVFNADDGFSRYIGKDVELTILYNFGAFEYLKGASTYYNQASPYFSAFYGAYIVKDQDKPFGFQLNGDLNYEEIAAIPEYDMKTLVLRSIGCMNPEFTFELDDSYREQEFLGYEDWNVVDASITTNSPMHDYTTNHQAYIQYGKPPQEDYKGEDFESVKVYGKIYMKYFEEKKATVFFYVIAPNQEVIEETDKNFLRKSKLQM